MCIRDSTYTVRDTTGVKVSPLIYNGTTYLPLSSLGQLLDVYKRQGGWPSSR